MKSKRLYQQGGSWQEGMMKSRMATAAALGNPSAIRMTQLYPMIYTFTGREGTDVPAGEIGTHYMSSMGEYAVPFIQERNGKLIYNKKASPRDKEAMRFNTPEEADYFAEHYKDVAPMMREFQFGGYSTQGYKQNSPDRHNDFNVIPSGNITMRDVPYPVYGTDNLGNEKIMMPGQDYNFPGHTVYEIPLKDNNMKKPLQKLMQKGGATYDNGVFFANGGPAFPIAGAGPMFMMGGSAQVNPFAMNPGSGFGGGMLEEYADETMKKGGHAKKQKKLSPQQIQMMMQAMAGAQQQQQGPSGMPPPQGQPPMGMPPQGMMPPQQGMAPQGMMKLGGRGMQQGGNTIRDAQGNIFAYGGQVNPYHPLAKFMQDGGSTDDTPPEEGDKDPSGGAGEPNDPNNDPVNNPPDLNNPNNPEQGDGKQNGNGQSGWNKFNRGASMVLTGLGAAAGIGAAYADRADQRRNAAYQRSLGMSDHIAPVNQPGSHGDYTQYGNFRPDATTPTRPGNFYPMHQFGGPFAFGGNYSAGGFAHGQELELSDAEIAHMKKMGYKFEEL